MSQDIYPPIHVTVGQNDSKNQPDRQDGDAWPPGLGQSLEALHTAHDLDQDIRKLAIETVDYKEPSRFGNKLFLSALTVEDWHL